MEPCPNCVSDKIHVRREEGIDQAICKQCGLTMPLAFWNHRPIQDSLLLRIRDLEGRSKALSQTIDKLTVALGMLSTLAPTCPINLSDPVGMAKFIVNYVEPGRVKDNHA